MITYSRLGSPKRGRLGNQLFQIAATVGLARYFGHPYAFPAWRYSPFFKNQLPVGEPSKDVLQVPEAHFRLDMGGFEQYKPFDFDVDGWRQTEWYWKKSEAEVRELFQWHPPFIDNVRGMYPKLWKRPCIAISVRRGDFVGNPNYAQLPAAYYYLALLEQFPDWRKHNIVIFSDDLAYCRIHFEGLPNVTFAEGTDIEQLALMTQCKHFIVSNSTFSWWGAWLGEKENSKVVRPNYLFDGELKRRNSDADYWPARWTVFDHVGKKLDLRDMTFTIPVFIDHKHRQQNLELCVCMLHRDLDTSVIIGEQGPRPTMSKLAAQGAYMSFKHLAHFHRTRMLNDMARAATTPYVANWDCDVFVPPLQLWLAVERLRAGEDMVYPYDGRFARVPRSWFPQLEKTLDLGVFRDTELKGKHGKPVPTTSVGGAIFFNRASFFQGGAENEYMVSFGPEDWERNHRFKALGYTVTRVRGALYHLDHWCGPDSSTRNPYFKANHRELDELRALTPEQLDAYVQSWPWRVV